MLLVSQSNTNTSTASTRYIKQWTHPLIHTWCSIFPSSVTTQWLKHRQGGRIRSAKLHHADLHAIIVAGCKIKRRSRSTKLMSRGFDHAYHFTGSRVKFKGSYVAIVTMYNKHVYSKIIITSNHDQCMHAMITVI